MALIPLMHDGKLEDGAYIHLLPFCKNNCSKEICASHYAHLKESEPGVYPCPYGLSSIVYSMPTENLIFTGLRIKGTYNKKRAKVTECDHPIFNPQISEENCMAIATEVAKGIAENSTLQKKFEAINDLLHETRTLNRNIKNSIDEIWDAQKNEEDIEKDTLLTLLKNAHVNSYMIYNRFSYFDSLLNPTLSIGSPYFHVIFKKFDKMRKLLKGYKRKNVWINLKPQNQRSEYRYPILPTFEILLFILLENAIKYSPNDLPVNVDFVESGSTLDVTISSLGPYCDENEILLLCQKGYRGEQARVVEEQGQGFGLSFAKQIAGAHKVGISFESKYSHKDQGIKYGTFSVHLHFDNTTPPLS